MPGALPASSTETANAASEADSSVGKIMPDSDAVDERREETENRLDVNDERRD